MLFDSHAHYDNEKFDEDRDEIINNAFKSGVKYILNPSSSPESIQRCVDISNKYPHIFAAVGIHPHDASQINEDILLKIEDLTKEVKVVAIGEIGLDYHYDFSPRELQKKYFEAQIEIAKKVNLPIIVHNRDASEDSLKLIKQTNAKNVGGVFHCFSGSLEIAKTLLHNNFYISFGGPITFKNAKKSSEIIKEIPLNRILIETDAPYLSPEPFRGKRNNSALVIHVAEKIAQIKEVALDLVITKTCQNALELFNIKSNF